MEESSTLVAHDDAVVTVGHDVGGPYVTFGNSKNPDDHGIVFLNEGVTALLDFLERRVPEVMD